MLRRLFLAHPASVGESYAEHFGVASRFGARMMAGGVGALVHAVLPFAFNTTGSRTIETRTSTGSTSASTTADRTTSPAALRPRPPRRGQPPLRQRPLARVLLDPLPRRGRAGSNPTNQSSSARLARQLPDQPHESPRGRRPRADSDVPRSCSSFVPTAEFADHEGDSGIGAGADLSWIVQGKAETVGGCVGGAWLGGEGYCVEGW